MHHRSMKSAWAHKARSTKPTQIVKKVPINISNMRTINSSAAPSTSHSSSFRQPIPLDRNKRPRVSPNAGIFSRDAAAPPRPSLRLPPTGSRPPASSLRPHHQSSTIDRRQDNDGQKLPPTTTRQQEQQQEHPSLLSSILEQFTCGSSGTIVVDDEPSVVSYEPRRYGCESTSSSSSSMLLLSTSSSTCSSPSSWAAPPMSPPVLYVHRYRQQDDEAKDDKREEPAPRDGAAGIAAALKKVQSFDTEITAATSHTDGSSEEDSTEFGPLGKTKIPSLEDQLQLDGRATPVVSNRSSSIMRGRSQPDNDDEDDARWSYLAGIGPLQQCVCFDDDDVQEAPHAQSIMLENRSRCWLAMIMMTYEQP